MNNIKNPLLDLEEDISKMPKRLSLFEKIGLASGLILSLGILILSIISLFIDIFVKLNFLSIFIDLIVMTMSVATTYFIFNLLKSKMITEVLIDTAFQHGVYVRLQSLIENIAESQTGTDVLIDRVSNLDLKVENILKEKRHEIKSEKTIMQENIALGTSVKFVVKSIFMIVITMALFMFLVNFNLGRITPIVALSIFILWWLFITNEYNLWKDSSAWSMIFFPILVVPVTVLILSNTLNYNVMMALIYLLLGIYSLLYYIWAVYAATGSLPFVTPIQDNAGELGEFFASQQKGIFQEVKDTIYKRKI